MGNSEQWWNAFEDQLFGEPDPQRWACICDLMDQAPEGVDLPGAVAQAIRALACWPAEERVAPDTWKQELLQSGEVGPGWPLVRRLELEDGELDLEALERVVTLPQLERITELSIGRSGLGAEGATALASSPGWPGSRPSPCAGAGSDRWAPRRWLLRPS